ncbi:uncharacterized protein LOC113227651 [Hyposmocoma kahamanoa]|uniref:uncharacterized protein LOC113227651 n=1 Tax=Hyposmocoma kahamanoa TaxID=1477025 RepID=UPI000E6D8ABF|nr:uncharacterized protein LOC113227651 [Hyposmocoma kahamanoa]
MAIAFNLPSEREATEENFSRLNRLLAELYEVLCHILVSRQPGQEAQENRRERPFSESDIDRPGPAPQPQQCRRSASSSPPALTIDSNLEDDVFVSPRTANGNDLFSSRNLEIFGYGSPRTPAGVLLNGRSERSFTFSVSSQKQCRDKGGTDHADGAHAAYTDDDDANAASNENQQDERGSSVSSVISSITPYKVSGSICTAILLMLGWTILSHKRFSDTQPSLGVLEETV